MQTHKRILPLTCLLLLAPAAASAEGWYIEGNAGIDRPDILQYTGRDDLSIPTIGARAGYDLSKTWSIESDLRVGLQDGDTSLEAIGVNAEVGLNLAAGVFARASAPLGEQLSAHLRIGAAVSEYDYEIVHTDGVAGTDQYSGLAFGAGAEFDLSEDLYVRTDYTIYELPGEDSGSLTLGVGLKF